MVYSSFIRISCLEPRVCGSFLEKIMIMFNSILELKLCLLHELLAVESAREVFSNIQYNNLLEDVYEGKTLRSHIEYLVSIGDNFSKDYIECLTSIRIFLLGS